ncbi:MAG: hypothetical protein NTX57_14800 [Armatimonadetes bacterium]|jgi:hypothetical protein|nr:hypothetical protein [Armatimonadota bacterium]
MAYNRFTLPEVEAQFGLTIERDTPLEALEKILGILLELVS